MTSSPKGGGKLPGKTIYAGRRRAMTRTSGFSVHEDTSGGEFRRHFEPVVEMKRGDQVRVVFRISGHSQGDLLGYGAWFWHTPNVSRTIAGGPVKRTLTEYVADSWNKVGSIWVADDEAPVEIVFTLTAQAAGKVAVFEPSCGRLQHKHLDDARPALLKNMFQFSPEAIFVEDASEGEVVVEAPDHVYSRDVDVVLKSCNRCGRYLPINLPTERDQLSFSNHCVAPHRRPCSHATFGRLRNVEDPSEVLQLEYGFQLECRFCKKFEVNAAHNPQRSSAQMKEDGARRRAFELLLEVLYGGTPQLRYRHLTGGAELSDDIWEKFGHACFNCGSALDSAREMHLDHTRPLALLWPLDSTATALCGPCNSEKRDRAPSDFYSPEKLVKLAFITGLTIEELVATHPNEQALALLMTKLDWFFDTFLQRDEMIKERDGKITGELVVKALQKVISRSAAHQKIDLRHEYDRRRKQD